RFDMTADEDWYSFDITDTSNVVQLITVTPAGGPNAFDNLLDPHIELYDPLGGLLKSGLPQSDGRNETIQFQPTASGFYRVRVTSDNNSAGEYVLAKDLVPVASNLGLATDE